MGEVTFWIGQAFTVLAVIISFISYQMKTNRGILVALTLATLMSCIGYAILGRAGGLWLNVVCIIRNICYYFKDKKILSSKLVPVVLAVVMGIMGALSWEAYYSVFFVVGLVLNTLAMGYFGPQNLRKSILLTSSLILIYNVGPILGPVFTGEIFSGSSEAVSLIKSVPVGGVINESVSIASAIIGLIRYRHTSDENPTA
jgi:hypothetical protein